MINLHPQANFKWFFKQFQGVEHGCSTLTVSKSHADKVSHAKKKTLTFHYTGCLVGILIMVYSNPHITGVV